MKLSEALKIRSFIEKAIVSLEDPDALNVPTLFPSWQTEKVYSEGDRVCFDGSLYKCITAHTSQADWTPDAAVSLFVKVTDPSVEYPEWIAPSGVHDAYSLDAKVSHNDKKWVSTLDANVYEPGVYGWKEVTAS